MDEDDDGDDDDGGSQKRRDSKSTKVKSEASSNSIVPIRPGPPSHDPSGSPEVRFLAFSSAYTQVLTS